MGLVAFPGALSQQRLWRTQRHKEGQGRRWRRLEGSTDKKTDIGSSVSGAMVTVPEYGCTETTVAERPKSKPRNGSVVVTRSPFKKLVATGGLTLSCRVRGAGCPSAEGRFQGERLGRDISIWVMA